MEDGRPASPRIANSRITAVTLYTDRAIVTRTAELEIPAGEHEVVLERLPLGIDDNSLQVSLHVTSAASLLDVQCRPQWATAEGSSLQQLENQLHELRRQKREIRDRDRVLKSQQALLLRVQPGTQEMPDIENLQRLLDFNETSLEKLLSERRHLDERCEALELQSQKLKQARSHLGVTNNYKAAVLRIRMEAPGRAQLQLSYSLNQASWEPAYEVRLHEEDGQIELTYQGIVRQATGEDWQDVNLTLSTAQPVGSKVPELLPWRVDIQPVFVTLGEIEDQPLLAAAPAPAMRQKAEVHGPISSASFRIPSLASLRSDGSSQKLLITQLKLPSSFTYLAVPALGEQVYRQAESLNSSDYPLLAGTLNTFLDNTFVASSRLQTVMPGESFELSLGSDESIAIKRHLLKRFTEKAGFTGLGGRHRTTYEYRIEVHNKHKEQQRLQFRDRLPVSGNEQIEVKLLEPVAKTITQEEGGLVKWDWTLGPGEKRSTLFKFSLEYSKDISVYGLE